MLNPVTIFKNICSLCSCKWNNLTCFSGVSSDLYSHVWTVGTYRCSWLKYWKYIYTYMYTIVQLTQKKQWWRLSFTVCLCHNMWLTRGGDGYMKCPHVVCLYNQSHSYHFYTTYSLATFISSVIGAGYFNLRQACLLYPYELLQPFQLCLWIVCVPLQKRMKFSCIVQSGLHFPKYIHSLSSWCTPLPPWATTSIFRLNTPRHSKSQSIKYDVHKRCQQHKRVCSCKAKIKLLNVSIRLWMVRIYLGNIRGSLSRQILGFR